MGCACAVGVAYLLLHHIVQSAVLEGLCSSVVCCRRGQSRCSTQPLLLTLVTANEAHGLDGEALLAALDHLRKGQVPFGKYLRVHLLAVALQIVGSLAGVPNVVAIILVILVPYLPTVSARRAAKSLLQGGGYKAGAWYSYTVASKTDRRSRSRTQQPTAAVCRPPTASRRTICPP
jgi:hypothetical protein